MVYVGPSFKTRVAYFELEDFAQAKAQFNIALEKRSKSVANKDISGYQRYIRKCDAEIAGKGLV